MDDEADFDRSSELQVRVRGFITHVRLLVRKAVTEWFLNAASRHKARDTRSRNRGFGNRRHKFDARFRRQFFVPMHDYF